MIHKGVTQAELDAKAAKVNMEIEQKALIASLEASRYHLDIAQELGEPVWPEVLEARNKARVRLGEITKALKATE